MDILSLGSFLRLDQTAELIITEPPYSKNDAVTDKKYKATICTKSRSHTRGFDVGIIDFLTSLSTTLIASIYSEKGVSSMFLDDDLEDLVLKFEGPKKLKIEYQNCVVVDDVDVAEMIVDCLSLLACEMRTAVNEGRTVPSYLGGPRLNISWGSSRIVDIPR